MPKVRRHNVPSGVLGHLLDRIKERSISADQLGLLAEWLDTVPIVPEGKWFKRFPGMIVCGKGGIRLHFSDPWAGALWRGDPVMIFP